MRQAEREIKALRDAVIERAAEWYFCDGFDSGESSNALIKALQRLFERCPWAAPTSDELATLEPADD